MSSFKIDERATNDTSISDSNNQSNEKTLPDRKFLASIWNNSEINSNRILEKNSITVIGIPSKICNQEILSGPEYFGAFGEIEIMTVKCRAEMHNGLELSNFACVRYKRWYDAAIALSTIESTNYKNFPNLNASFGTTKFCKSYVKKGSCDKEKCQFFHGHPSTELMIYSKEDPYKLTFIKAHQEMGFGIIMKSIDQVISHKFDSIPENVQPKFGTPEIGLKYLKFLSEKMEHITHLKCLRQFYRKKRGEFTEAE